MYKHEFVIVDEERRDEMKKKQEQNVENTVANTSNGDGTYRKIQEHDGRSDIQNSWRDRGGCIRSVIATNVPTQLFRFELSCLLVTKKSHHKNTLILVSFCLIFVLYTWLWIVINNGKTARTESQKSKYRFINGTRNTTVHNHNAFNNSKIVEMRLFT